MSKRGENIYKRKDGRWEARLKMPNGNYAYIYGQTYTEVKERKKERIKNESSWHDNAEFSNKKIIKKLDEWLNDCSQRVKLSTYENYYYCMRTYVYPFFEKIKTNSFTKAELDSFVSYIKCNPSLSCSYKNKILNIFKVALGTILTDDNNKKKLLDMLKPSKIQTQMIEVFSLDEQQKIETELIQNGSLKAICILLCFYTGLRLGELGALKWNNIDLTAKTISITGTLSRKKNFNEGINKTILYISSPKNHSSNRQIPLSDFLIEILKKIKTNETKEGIFLLSNSSKPMDGRTLQKYYKNILQKIGISYRKFHTIRHTFATRALEMGVDIKTVSELLGHSSVTNTLNIYAHSLLEQKKIAMAKLNHMHISQMIFKPSIAPKETKTH